MQENRWALDGTMDLLPDSEEKAEALFQDIIGENPDKYYNDAMIALVAIKNGCTVVVEDVRFYNKIIQHFPERVARYGEFIEGLKAL